MFFGWIQIRQITLNFSDTLYEGQIQYNNSIYNRKIELVDKKIKIIDNLNIKSKKHLNLHLSPDVLLKEDKDIILKSKNSSIRLIIKDDYEIENYQYSNEYGNVIPSKKIIINTVNEEIIIELEII